uniref:Uncharacterized protein n=1 Tax=Parascaris equorum TaxID=6256 RepID=A0A914S1Y3_PAREQ
MSFALINKEISISSDDHTHRYNNCIANDKRWAAIDQFILEGIGNCWW